MPPGLIRGVRRFDLGEVSSVERTDQGYLRCDGRITRTGVFTYRDGRGKLRRELRLPDEVFSDRALESFALAPLTNDHPREQLTAKNTGRFQVGTVVNPRPDERYVAARVQVTDEQAIADVEQGKHQLSCGYTADVEETAGLTFGIPGVPDGLRYDAIQRNIRGNHVALVDVGRAGPEVSLRLDGADAELIFDQDPTTVQTLIFSKERFSPEQAKSWAKEHGFGGKEPDETDESVRIRQRDPNEFQEGSFRTIELRPGVKAVTGRRKDADEKKKPRADAPDQGELFMTVKIKIDGVEFEVSESAAQAIAKEQAKLDEAQKNLAEQTELVATERARADKAEEDLGAEKKARADAEDPKRIRKAIDTRLDLERIAKPILGDEVKIDELAEDEIKRQVVIATASDAEAAKKKLDGCDPAYLTARFDAAVDGWEDDGRRSDALANVRRGAAQRTDGKNPRAEMIKRNSEAWKTKAG
jgi:hypothetical protein